MADDKNKKTPPIASQNSSSVQQNEKSGSSGEQNSKNREGLSHRQLKVRTMKDDMKELGGKKSAGDKSIAVELDQSSKPPHVDEFASQQEEVKPAKPFQAQGVMHPAGQQSSSTKPAKKNFTKPKSVVSAGDATSTTPSSGPTATVQAPKEAVAIGEEIKKEISKLKGDENEVKQQDFVESKPLNPDVVKSPSSQSVSGASSTTTPPPLSVSRPLDSSSSAQKPPVATHESSSKPGNIAHIPKKSNKLLFGTVIGILILAVIGGSLFYYFSNSDPDPIELPQPDSDPIAIATSTPPDQLPSLSSFTASKSLLTANDEVVIEVNSPIAVSHQLRLEGRKAQISDSLKRITFVLNEFVESSKLSTMRRFLASVGLIAADVRVTQREVTFSEFRDVMKVPLPGYMINYFSEKFDVFLYRQSDGPRVGLAMQLKDSHKIVENLKQWEETMAQDLTELYLDLNPQDPDILNEVTTSDLEQEEGVDTVPVAPPVFEEAVYAGEIIRLLRQPNDGIGIFYSYIADKQLLLVATSRDALEKMLESAASVSGNFPVQGPKEQQIVLESVTRDSFAQELRNVLQRTYSPGALIPIVVQFLGENERLEVVGDDKIEELFRIPQDVSSMSSGYRFAVFTELTGTNKLIMTADHSGEVSRISQSLRQWEPKMPEDLNIIVANFTLSDEGFLDSDYQGKSFRFIRLPDSKNGLSYLVGESNYFISTSKDSFIKAFERYLR